MAWRITEFEQLKIVANDKIEDAIFFNLWNLKKQFKQILKIKQSKGSIFCCH